MRRSSLDVISAFSHVHFLRALEDRARKAFLEILSESDKKVEIAHAQTSVKKAAIMVLIKLVHEAEKKTIKELETEIHKALEEVLAAISGSGCGESQHS